jgi:hypothetical protein
MLRWSRDHPERHAERAVDQLRGETDGDEREQGGQVEVAEIHARSPLSG